MNGNRGDFHRQSDASMYGIPSQARPLTPSSPHHPTYSERGFKIMKGCTLSLTSVQCMLPLGVVIFFFGISVALGAPPSLWKQIVTMVMVVVGLILLATYTTIICLAKNKYDESTQTTDLEDVGQFVGPNWGRMNLPTRGATTPPETPLGAVPIPYTQISFINPPTQGYPDGQPTISPLYPCFTPEGSYMMGDDPMTDPQLNNPGNQTQTESYKGYRKPSLVLK